MIIVMCKFETFKLPKDIFYTNQHVCMMVINE